MADNFILCIADDYPESYWLKTKIPTGEDPAKFKEGAIVDVSVCVRFECSKKVSANKLLSYDFLHSDGPYLISPRLYEIMVREKITGVQFVDAELVLEGSTHTDYKIFNIIETSPAFDLIKSASEPLLSYLSDGPKWYTKIVLKHDLELPSDIVRAEEESTTIVVTARVKRLMESNAIRGIKFKI